MNTKFLLQKVALILLVACGCGIPQPALNPDGSTAMLQLRLSKELEYHAGEPQSMDLVRSKIQQFELSSQRRTCNDIQFAGYDGKGDEVLPGVTRVKATAMSTCGPGYYWFQKREETGRITSLEIEARAPQKGDKVFVRGTYGKWELSRQR